MTARSTLKGIFSHGKVNLMKVGLVMLCFLLHSSAYSVCLRGSDCCLRSSNYCPRTFSPPSMTHYSGNTSCCLAAACGSCLAAARLFLGGSPLGSRGSTSSCSLGEYKPFSFCQAGWPQGTCVPTCCRRNPICSQLASIIVTKVVVGFLIGLLQCGLQFPADRF